MLKAKTTAVPQKPGVYLFKDSKKNVLYVGKAKNLRNRLRSYFQKTSGIDMRKSAMVKSAKDFSYLITNNELEALVLEATLIKQHKPKFNVVLRDDKNYPYLKLTINEAWPGLEVVRKIKKDGARYFGPYVPAGNMWEALNFIRKNFQIRPCRYSLDKPMRPCIQYQMKRCPAPCNGLISKKDYICIVNEVKFFLMGKKRELLAELGEKMKRLSDELRYEEAAKIRDSIGNLEKIWESQKVAAPELGDIDIMGFYKEENEAVFQVFFIRNGVLIGSKNFHLKGIGNISEKELLHKFIEQFYTNEIIPPDEIIANTKPEGAVILSSWLSEIRSKKQDKKQKKIKMTMPKKGKKLELLRMAEENAKITFKNKVRIDFEDSIAKLKETLGLKKSPKSIGALDVSTISGSESVGAFIYWAEGEFKKDMYRHLKIKNVEGMNDFAMMKEISERTIKNLKHKLPSLMVIDGGIGQLQSARKAFDEAGIKNTELVSIAKNPDRLFTLKSEKPVDLRDNSALSLLLKKIRDEAHRFAVSFHRKLRDKRLMESPLEKIKGIGRKRRLELLKHFGSIEDIRKAGIDDIAGIKGFNNGIAEKLLGELRAKK
ncbi:MAG: excinuclease ABC subunit UvrC [Nitrospiraceae bacterium]|nr:excinuclease ABC subunit UvrC [Nitrospiraceae bacterium]